MGKKATDAAAVAIEVASVTSARLLAALDLASHVLTTCPRCDGPRLGRWGTTRRGLQRWRCRACGRTCSAGTGTALAHIHSLDKLREIAADMLAETPASCRALAAALDLDRMTVWRSRRLIADAWAALLATCPAVANGPEAETAVTLRESRKASREWVRHRRNPACFPAPDRMRWTDYRQQRLPLPEPMSRYRISVALQPGASGDVPPTSIQCASATHQGAGAPPSGQSAAPSRHATSTGRSCDPVDRPMSSAWLASRFQTFLVPFAGPATRHLRAYVAWFRARVACIG